MSRIEEVLALVNQIPPFPKVARRVIELLEDPDVNADHLADVIQYDQIITADILKMCNAAYFGLPHKLTSIHEAVVMLGHDSLKDLVMVGASVGFYKGEAGGGYELEEGELWKHSVAVALMAKLLGRYVRNVDPGSAFTVGLLHDIGKKFLSAFVHDDFERIMAEVGGSGASFVEAEHAVVGIDHAELGAMILEKWEFTPLQVEAVRKHHSLTAFEGKPLTALTALSDSLIKNIGLGEVGTAPEVREDISASLGISQEKVQSCVSELVPEMDKAREVVNM